MCKKSSYPTIYIAYIMTIELVNVLNEVLTTFIITTYK